MNCPTFIIAAIVAAIFIAIIIYPYRSKKKNPDACSRGGGCSGCPLSGGCHH